MITKENGFQFFKYSIYILLTMNMYFFISEEIAAFPVRYPNGIAISQIYEGFAASIDTIAWLILLWALELETYILEDKQITKTIKISLFLTKAICYGFIVFAFFGYCANLLFFYHAETIAQITNLCQLTNNNWSYSIDINEYISINSENCISLSTANEFVQFKGLNALVDQNGLIEIIRLGWIDVINSGVWLLVVIVIEVNINIVEKSLHQLELLSKNISNLSKYVLYPILFFNAFYWGIKGDFIDFWDAFLWLVAFVFIELNIIDWDDSKGPNPNQSNELAI
ncbi:MAG: hypothetical protein VYC67_05290 [Pseudomonadota bacterium]|nr:hypothetical protein [Pseudomonadota bacterium]